MREMVPIVPMRPMAVPTKKSGPLPEDEGWAALCCCVGRAVLVVFVKKIRCQRKKALTPRKFLSTVQALPNVETARANKLGSLPEEERKADPLPFPPHAGIQYPGGVPAVAGEPLRGDAKRSNSRGKNCPQISVSCCGEVYAFRIYYTGEYL